MKKLFYTFTVLLGLSTLFTTVSCIDNEPDRESYYVFTGKTVASRLTDGNDSEQFTEFVQVLERAHLLDLLSTYGDFTCFAPTNEAVQTYLKSKGFASIDDMPEAECDTLAWMHVLKAAYYISDNLYNKGFCNR